jgi:hypothetical protein
MVRPYIQRKNANRLGPEMAVLPEKETHFTFTFIIIREARSLSLD